MYDLPGFFYRAQVESSKSDFARLRIGAVISRGGSVISEGHNINRTHTLHKNWSIHAEMAAIISKRYYYNFLSGATIWVYRQTRDGKPALAKPCRYCMEHIIEAGIKKIYYTVNKEPYYKIIKCLQREGL